jgi:choice-of-anchor B domain-containing protein
LFTLQIFTFSSQENKNIKLLDKWFEDSLITNSSKVRYSGCWGFTFSGKEYAVIGSTEGYHFFYLTTSDSIKPCGFIEGKFNSPLVSHREIKTFDHYAYLVCDEGNSSLQIVDLHYLPDSVVKVADIQDSRFGKIHNLFIDTINARLYACLVTPISNGTIQKKIPLSVFSLTNPTNPLLLWEGPEDIPEVHDCYVSNNLAILNCGMDGIRIYDFSNPSTPVLKNIMSIYPDQGYNHQGWLSPNRHIYVFADETSGKRIKKCVLGEDFNLSIKSYFGTNFTNNSVPHNIMIDNEFAYVAYYNEGLRIFDIRNNPREIAAYDTYPEESFFNMNGAWGVYSGFPSERIIVSDRQHGLFLFSWNRELFLNSYSEVFELYPNPCNVNELAILRTPNDVITNFTARLMDATGKVLCVYENENFSYLNISGPTYQGIFFVEITHTNYLGESFRLFKKWIIT